MATPIPWPQATPVNPLTGMQQFADLAMKANAINQYQGKVLAGHIFQQSIDPTTGQVDMQKFGAGLAANPAAAPYAMEAHQAAQNNVLTRLQQQGQTLDNARKELDTTGAIFGELASKGMNISDKDITTAGSDLVNAGIPAKKVAAEIANFPTDPQGRWNYAKMFLGRTQQAATIINTLFPHPQTVSTGDAQHVVDTNPVTNSGYVGTTIKQGLNPAQAASPTQIPQPSGAVVTEPLGQFAQSNNIPTAGSVVPGNKLVAPQAAPPNKLAPQPVQPSQPAQPKIGGGAVMGPAPGVVAAAQTTGTRSANSFSDLADKVSALPKTMSIVDQMLSEVPKAGMGPASTTIASMQALGKEFGIPGLEGATATQLVNKDAMQLVSAQTESLGMHADGAMEKVLLGNPNSHLTGEAAYGAAAMIKGNAEAAAIMEREAAGWPSTDWKGFVAQWNSNSLHKNLPAIMTFQYLPTSQKLAFKRMLEKEGRADSFLKDLYEARKAGYIK